uniref:SDR family NAD(P)-dependent oxidoreductase n=1 Tax=uncultured Draconibacterium sp. TaxID=1573823 RepID=UPI0032173DC4
MKHAVITGSSRGIGLALTRKLIAENNIEIIGSSTSGKHSLQSANFSCYPLNLNDKKSIEAFVKQIENKKIDYLVNNAGILQYSDNPGIDFQKLEETFNVNLFGTIRFTELLISRLNQNAHIVTVTSEWGSFSEPGFNEYQPHYKMSKAALNMYSKLLSERLKKRGIRVSAFDPGWVKTDMGGKNASRTPEEVATELLYLMKSKVETGNFWHKGKIREW